MEMLTTAGYVKMRCAEEICIKSCENALKMHAVASFCG